MKPTILLLALAMAAIPATSVRADLLDNLTVDIRLGRRPPPPPPPVVVVVPDERRGPDMWERREHWYARSQAYYYYPGADVYYRQSDHVWFYRDRGEWRSGRNLPDYVHVDFNRSVTVNMFTDRPYIYHSQIVTRYPPNYFGTRVRLRDEDRRDDNRHDDNRRDKDHNDHDGRDSDHDGRDKDRDHRK